MDDPTLCRTSISMGETSMSASDVRAEIASLGDYFRGNQYHLIMRNCNHFSDALCERLTNRRIPGWWIIGRTVDGGGRGNSCELFRMPAQPATRT